MYTSFTLILIIIFISICPGSTKSINNSNVSLGKILNSNKTRIDAVLKTSLNKIRAILSNTTSFKRKRKENVFSWLYNKYAFGISETNECLENCKCNCTKSKINGTVSKSKY